MDANRTTEGTGLGMSITQNLLHLMNGRIDVKSVVDVGSVFTVHLLQERTDSIVLGKELVENLQNFSISSEKQMTRTQVIAEGMPYGSVLIVDDVESNLYVAKGLMTRYELSIDTVMSGFEAIEKVKSGKVYDIIFMDHMMPKMDGVETTKKMRESGYTHPIVALTANAVVGQADVFLTKGFDGFISKPIDIRQLNATLKKFIRDKQPSEVIEAAQKKEESQEVQTENITEQPSVKPELAKIFVRDAHKAIKTLESIYEKRDNDNFQDEDIRMYTINVHALKSALANIGETTLSDFAAKLEEASRKKDFSVIISETSEFLSELQIIIDKFTQPEETDEITETADEDYAYLRDELLAIIKACETYDKKTIKDTLSEINQKAWPHQTKELLEIISEHLLHTDFEEIARVAEDFIEKN
jgi:CheY-like chemotaxis protein/HPt (histidine-containing phosphotransfer) domain-containing protein